MWDGKFDINYYTDYDAFLEHQSLKDLSYIIIREKIDPKIDASLNSDQAKTLENLHELGYIFGLEGSNRMITLKQKLINYIKKYSLDKLLLYLMVDDVLNTKIPDY